MLQSPQSKLKSGQIQSPQLGQTQSPQLGQSQSPQSGQSPKLQQSGPSKHPQLMS